jgi:hypothetical protein
LKNLTKTPPLEISPSNYPPGQTSPLGKYILQQIQQFFKKNFNNWNYAVRTHVQLAYRNGYVTEKKRRANSTAQPACTAPKLKAKKHS